MPARRRQFHTFDALRFLAFFKVFVFHLPITAFPVFAFLKAGGGIGVEFFFVLSGFLITWLLLEEKQRTGGLNLRHFFMRRVLRIWPLYYAMLLFALLTPWLLGLLHLEASGEGYAPNWLFSALFLENYQMMYTGAEPNVSPLGVMWSLCIEEHFYIVWGLVFWLIPLRRVPVLLGAAILLAPAARLLYSGMGWRALDLVTHLDYFAWGAVPAWLLVQHEGETLRRLRSLSRVVPWAFLAVLVTWVVLLPHIPWGGAAFLSPVFSGILFGGLLLLLLPEDSSLRVGDRHPLSRLGVFTYGLYMTHTIVINLCLKLFLKMDMPPDTGVNALLLALSSLLLTLVAAFLSWKLIEKPFLRLKARFS